MKKYLILILLVWQMTSAVHSQIIAADKVPAKVLMAYQIYFPEAQHTRWVIQADSNYGVLFTLYKGERVSFLTPSGEWIQHRCSINFETLPAAIKDAAQKKYSGFETAQAWKLENSRGEVDYQVFFTDHNKLWVVNFSPTGDITAEKRGRVVLNKR